MSSSVAAVEPTSSVGPEFFNPSLPIEQLRASPLNPRKTFDPERLCELAMSIKSNGVLEPLGARRVDDHYELVWGERRLRAAKMAELTHLPVMVRSLTDAQALEIMVIENKQREDVDALDEACGFRALLDTGYELDKLVDRIGLSKKYVYDRLKLLQLIPEAQELLTAGHITAGHAILLARLKPSDQARAIDLSEGGLFFLQADGDDEPTETEPFRGRDLVSVREFDAWIARFVRLDLSKPVASEDFPAIARAQEMAARVVSITHERYLGPAQQEGAAAGDRILLADEWKRADGGTLLDAVEGRPVTHPGCTLSLLGVVVIGRDRGSAFPVCIDRSCDIHWKKERTQAARADQDSDHEDDDDGGAIDRRSGAQDRQEQEWRARQDRLAAERAAYRTGAPRILAACVARVKAMKPGVLADAVVAGAAFHPLALKAFPKAKTAEDLLRIIAVSFVAEGLQNEYSAPEQVPLWAKRFGVDLKPLLKPEAPVQPSAQKKASAKKKPGKGRR